MKRPVHVDEYGLPLRLRQTVGGVIAIPWSRNLLKKFLGPTLRIYVDTEGTHIHVNGACVASGKNLQEAASKALVVDKASLQGVDSEVK